jgi:hypothetical protein
LRGFSTVKRCRLLPLLLAHHRPGRGGFDQALVRSQQLRLEPTRSTARAGMTSYASNIATRF